MRVLVVAAHPDDEVLGCGGTLARHTATGDTVNVFLCTDGVGARGSALGSPVDREARKKAALEAAKLLGTKAPHMEDFPDNRLDSVPLLDVVQAVEAYAVECEPEVVYTHHSADLNVDHRLVHEAVMTAFRPQSQTSVSTILCFETPSSTEWRAPTETHGFLPNWFVDIRETLDQKRAALLSYSAEMRPFPHPRSVRAIEALAEWRGASVGHNAAEAFVVARHVR